MARLKKAESVLRAAELWKERCLLDDGSLFSDDRLWTRENFQLLHDHFVGNPMEGKKSFLEKLKLQLAPAPPRVSKLAAEVLWVMYLVVRDMMHPSTKKVQVTRVWKWSGDDPPDAPFLLDEAPDPGVINTGVAFNTQRWREFRFFIFLMLAWKALDRPERERLLSDPWEFAEWLEKQEEASARQLRHIFLFLLFPDHFERISTNYHKKNIIRAFRSRWGEGTEDVDFDDRISIDRALLDIRQRAAEEYDESDELDFYEPPLDEVWRDQEEAGDEEVPAGAQLILSHEDAAEWIEARFGNATVWVMSAGQGARLWEEFENEGIIAVGWDFLGDLSQYNSREEIATAIMEHRDSDVTPRNNSLACYQFAHEMEVGDIVLMKRGRSALLGYGTITSEYRYDPDRSEYQHLRDVRWEETGSWTIPRPRWITNKTLTEFRQYPAWVHWAFHRMDVGGDEGGADPNGSDIVLLADALEELFLDAPDFTRLRDTLERKKNVILQGPPGVGKTFAARWLAWVVIGRRDSRRVRMVQFHQSYSYEDFIQGWRPAEGGGFERRDGVFLGFCEEARRDPDSKYVFLVDEINRGNLSKILGEVMMLLEADKRSEEYAVPLTYAEPGEDPFWIPPNVYVIGMMNTADRSLAMVDYALRRRFSFFDLPPAFGHEKFTDFLASFGVEDDLIGRIVDRMTSLNSRIEADEKNLGPGFEIGHSYFCPQEGDEGVDEGWYEEIVRGEIEPLLREYWFDRPQQVDEQVARLLG